MNLCEQYYDRHQILVPIIKHINFGSLFFRSNDFPFWKVITVSWREPLHQPGTYLIGERYINKFSHEIISNKCKKEFEYIVGWDDYENFLTNIPNRFNLQNYSIVKSPKDASLFAWEVFVYSQEKTFAQKFLHLEKYLFDSINLDNDLESRYFAYLSFTKDYMKFSDKDSENLSNLYQNVMSPYLDNYVYWLARLI